MSDRINENSEQIDRKTSRSICDAVGERLRQNMLPEQSSLPSRLQQLIDDRIARDAFRFRMEVQQNAVAKNREVMGATNPDNADAGTIRKVHAESIEANSVHGSDSAENAAIEIDFFFTPEEIVG